MTVTSQPVRLSLALQGGGAHGAYTWGVLDALLAEAAARTEHLIKESLAQAETLGRIFGADPSDVPVDEVIRIRTGERGDSAL